MISVRIGVRPGHRQLLSCPLARPGSAMARSSTRRVGDDEVVQATQELSVDPVLGAVARGTLLDHPRCAGAASSPRRARARSWRISRQQSMRSRSCSSKRASISSKLARRSSRSAPRVMTSSRDESVESMGTAPFAWVVSGVEHHRRRTVGPSGWMHPNPGHVDSAPYIDSFNTPGSYGANESSSNPPDVQGLRRSLLTRLTAVYSRGEGDVLSVLAGPATERRGRR